MSRYIIVHFLFLTLVFPGRPAMAQFISASVQQANNPILYPNTVNNPILVMKIVMGANPVVVDEFAFADISTNNLTDISAAKLWSYNDSVNFVASNAVLMKSYPAPFFSNFTFTPPFGGFTGFLPGDNYVWFTYDITPGAIICDTVDAESVGISVNGTSYIPQNYAPAGHSVITTTCLSSLTEADEMDLIDVFPLPFTDILNITISVNKPGPLRLELLDLAGSCKEILYDATTPATGLILQKDLQHLSQGFYLLKITSPRKEMFSKILKL